MQQYADVITDLKGNVVPGALVSILNLDGSLASLFASNGSTAIGNPVTTDSTGYFVFRAANGNYKRRVTAAGVSFDIPGEIVLYASGNEAVAASEISNTPTGNVNGTTVQQAINELESEKVPLFLLNSPSGAAQVGITPGGNIAGGNVQVALNELDTEKASLVQLAAVGGAALVNFKMAESGAQARTLQAKARDFMNANDFPGVDPTGTLDCTAALAAFIAAAKARYRGIEFSGIYKVNELLIDAVNSLHIRGDASFIGASSGAFDSVIELKNPQALTVSGDIVISGSHNNACEAGLKIWSSAGGSTSLVDLSSFCVVHAKHGFQIGDPTVPGRTLSEITIHGGYTFNCPNPLIAYGTQTFVNLVGCNIKSDASDDFPGAEEIGILCIGANVSQSGGELLHTASTTGSAVELRPILDGATATYGSYNGTGVVIETAAPLLETANPAALASPQPGIASGFVHCRGYHGHDLAPFVSTDSGFTGDLVFTANDFYAVAGRTQGNINCAGAAHIWCDDKSFGRNFKPALAGIAGGIPHFTQRMVLAVSNLAAQALPNATQTTLKYQTVISTGDMARFVGNYSASTGIFTVPAGGLKNVQIMCQQISGNITNGSLYLEINGALYGVANANAGGIAPVFFNVPQLAAGDEIKIVLYNIASGAQVAASQPYDFMHIFASN